MACRHAGGASESLSLATRRPVQLSSRSCSPRDLHAERSLHFAPKRRRTRRAHRFSPRQLLHPSRRPFHTAPSSSKVLRRPAECVFPCDVLQWHKAKPSTSPGLASPPHPGIASMFVRALRCLCRCGSARHRGAPVDVPSAAVVTQGAQDNSAVGLGRPNTLVRVDSVVAARTGEPRSRPRSPIYPQLQDAPTVFCEAWPRHPTCWGAPIRREPKVEPP